MDKLKVLILAGGAGTRLWPLSRSTFPKQFLKLNGQNQSFLQQTVDRTLKLVESKDLLILTHPNFEHIAREQLREIDSQLETRLILEPAQKNTAPALAYATRYLLEEGCDPNTLLFVSPSDHFVAPLDRYLSHIREGAALASKSLVTFGVRPNRPETGYGYIKARGNDVLAFVEKPDRENAEKMVLSGEYFWNAGLFLFSLKTLLEEIGKYAPHLSKMELNFSQFVENFPRMESISIDYAIMERSKRIKMVPMDLSWSDMGSWENVHELADKDENQNTLFGDVMTLESHNCLIHAESRLVCAVGVKDLYIVETADALLIVDRHQAQQVKQMVNELGAQKRMEKDEHRTVYRPWGHFTVLQEASRFKIKRIEVKPYHTLSLQMHYHRSEHWVVVSGTAEVMIGENRRFVHEGESIFVPKSAIHRVTNPGKVSLQIIEIQVGEYLGEDDIVRLDDVYGRVGKNLFEVLQKSVHEDRL